MASTKQVFFAAEEGTVRIACEQTCHSDANINQQWNLQVPWYRNFGFTDLTNVQLREKVEAHFGIQIRLGEDKAPCTNGSTHSIFYLDIEDVNASLNHAVVLCGVDNTSIQPSEKTFLPFAIYLVVNRIGKTKCRLQCPPNYSLGVKYNMPTSLSINKKLDTVGKTNVTF